MKISELVRDNSVSRNKAAYGSEQSERESEIATQDAANGDKVSISPLARQFAQVAELLSDEDAKRRARIADLKQQVEEGTYSVSSDDVAKSIVGYQAPDNG